jgi:hypothetical protein
MDVKNPTSTGSIPKILVREASGRAALEAADEFSPSHGSRGRLLPPPVERTETRADNIRRPSLQLRARSPSSGELSPAPGEAAGGAQVRWPSPVRWDASVLQEARNALALRLVEGVMAFDEIEHLVATAYAVELGRLMGDHVKVTPDRVDLRAGHATTVQSARMRRDAEVVKIVARVAFLNYAIHGARDQIVSQRSDPKLPLTQRTLDALSGELAAALRHGGAGLTDLESFVNALVLWSLGKSDALVRPRLRALGGVTEIPEERMAIVLGLGAREVPCLADTHPEALEVLATGARSAFCTSHWVQGEGPACFAAGLDMTPAQRRWYALHGVVCAAAASGMSEDGFFAPSETIVSRHLGLMRCMSRDITPAQAYFEFMRDQARAMDLPDSPEALPLIRLRLHARTTNAIDAALIMKAWRDLPGDARETLERGLSETGLTAEALRAALPDAWKGQADALGSDALATMIQYSPSLFTNSAHEDAFRLRSTLAGYTRALRLLEGLYREGQALVSRHRLEGVGVVRVDAQPLAQSARTGAPRSAPKLFPIEHQSKNPAVRLDAIGYSGLDDLARLESLVESGSLECKLMQILGENILAQAKAIGDGLEHNLRPSAIFRSRRAYVKAVGRADTTAPIHPDFAVTPATRAAFLPLVERFAPGTEAALGSARLYSAALPVETQALVDALKAALAGASAPLGLDVPGRFRAFIGVLDEVAAAALRSAPADHYGLRRAALAAGAGVIKSWHAFTYAKRCASAERDWAFTADMRNWLPSASRS